MRKLVLASLILLAGCAGGEIRFDFEAPAGSRGALQALAVYPFTYRYDHQPYQIYEKTQDAIAALVASGKMLVIGDDEFKIYPQHVGSDDPYATSTLMVAVHEMGLDRERIGVIRGWVEERVESTQKAAYTKSGRGAGKAAVYAATLICHLELLQPSTKKVLLEMSGEIEHDPFGEMVDWDPRPELRILHDRMLVVFLERIEDYFDLDAVPADVGFTYLVNRRPLFDYQFGDQPAYRKQLEQVDMLEREAAVQNRYRYFYPEADFKLFEKMEQRPPGLLVTGVTEPELAEAGLEVGDVVVRWRGVPVAGPHSMARLKHRAPNAAPAEFVVSREGREVTLKLPGEATSD